MNVFTEWHHGGLFHSQQLLWEKRLGGQLFGPVGYEWEREHIWNYSKNLDTIKQYLDPAYCQKREDGFYYYWDKAELIWQRRLTLEQFRKMKIDVVLCTLQEHEESFLQLRNRDHPNAKYVRLVGNTGEQVNWRLISNFIDTTGLYQPPEGIHAIKMGQEFPTETFYYTPPENHRTILNLMNCLKEADAYQIWLYLKNRLPEYKFLMHGSQGDDGMIDGLKAIGEIIRSCSFLFQIKHHGEGWGHIIHNAYACGRPAIAVMEYYEGKLASRMMIDGVSAIIIDNLEPAEVIKKIIYYSDPVRHLAMCQSARAKFEEFVNFDHDWLRFKEWVEYLQD